MTTTNIDKYDKSTGKGKKTKTNVNDASRKSGSRSSRPVITVALAASMILVLLIIESACFYYLNIEEMDDTNSSQVLSLKRSFKAQRQEVLRHRRKNKRRNRKVVLLGPHDRYDDFGDILTERVISGLLVNRSGYVFNHIDDQQNTVLLGGIVTRDDMDKHGLTPNKTIYSMKAIREKSGSDFVNGPYDIVFTGGNGEGSSVLSESYSAAIERLETDGLRKSAMDDQFYGCPYLFPKELLLRPINRTAPGVEKKHAKGSVLTLPHPKKNYAVVADGFEHQTLLRGGQEQPARASCKRALHSADHGWFQNGEIVPPDSSIMTRALFDDEIEKIYKMMVLPELFSYSSKALAFKKEDDDANYVVVQHDEYIFQSTSSPAYIKDLAAALDEVSRQLGNATIVFFDAGLVRPGRTTAATTYKKSLNSLSSSVAKQMKQPSIYFEHRHALKAVALIRGARAVLSTNLHVRIVSFLYQKPRVTWYGGLKHKRFMETWEARDVAALGIISSVQKTWKDGLHPFFTVVDDADDDETEEAAMVTQDETAEAAEKAIQAYLETFDRWSNLLTTLTENGEDDDDDNVV